MSDRRDLLRLWGMSNPTTWPERLDPNSRRIAEAIAASLAAPSVKANCAHCGTAPGATVGSLCTNCHSPLEPYRWADETPSDAPHTR